MGAGPRLADLTLANSDLSVGIAKQGGVLTFGTANDRPFLREARGEGATESSGFPMAPLCNRVAGNGFRFGGKAHVLAPNSADPLYLHGDAWLGRWQILSQDQTSALLSYEHDNGPYRYRAEQEIQLVENRLELALRVVNQGDALMPFGLGFHPFFPRADAKIAFSAAARWTEGPNHLPMARQPIAKDAGLRPLPSTWENNAYEGWDGTAKIRWRGLELTMEADPLFTTLMIYAPGEQEDFFCLEPMSHMPNAVNLLGQPGMQVLAPGESLRGGVRLTVKQTVDPTAQIN